MGYYVNMRSRLSLWGQQDRALPKGDAPASSTPYTQRPPSAPAPPAARRTTRAQTGAPPVQTREAPAEPSAPLSNTTPLPGSVSPNDVEAGAWEHRPRQTLPVPTVGDRRKKHYRKSRVAPDKTRRNTLSFSVSDEEESILRAHAATLDMSFSEWVRATLFRAAGRKIPSRSRGGSPIEGA